MKSQLPHVPIQTLRKAWLHMPGFFPAINEDTFIRHLIYCLDISEGQCMVMIILTIVMGVIFEDKMHIILKILFY
jgi:hypothetical protein